MVLVLRRVSGIGVRRQLSAAGLPLLSAAMMAAVVYLLRRALPTGLGALARLGLLGPAGALVFFGSTWLTDRANLLRGLEFAAAGLRRARGAASLSAPAAQTVPSRG
jgi:hypothetical protein